MKIVFFPSDSGGGFGHISRCICLAQEARNKGHEPVFILSDKKFFPKLKSQFTTFLIDQKPLVQSIKEKFLQKKPKINNPATSLFTEFSGLDYQVLRDGLGSLRIVNYRLKQYEAVIRKIKPDILIADTHMLAGLVGKKLDLPVVQVVRYASHPETKGIIWWKTADYECSAPNTAALFNPLLTKLNMPQIIKAEELLKGDLYIVPSIPEIEPIMDQKNLKYVGPLIFKREKEKNKGWGSFVKGNKPLIYITIGGGAGLVGSRNFFLTVIEALRNLDVNVIVSTAGKFTLSELTDIPDNVRFFDWVPAQEIIPQADLVIFHGGYGTMMEAVSCGKPMIIIPFHSEQEGNGRRLEQLGCAIVLKLSKEDFKIINCKWSYGKYAFLVQNHYDLDPSDLSAAVKKILIEEKYKKNSEILKNKISQYAQAKEALSLIEGFFKG
ncbi:MAG: nucleotide disphospho-sugar-binding domain-containing protein [Candidatus Omnitrophota bacterium]